MTTDTQPRWMERVAFYCAFGAAASIFFSIAVFNVLLALSLAALLISGAKFRLPPIQWPLGLFMLGTVVSLALSESPMAGRVQIRKFWVFLILLVISSTFREVRQVRQLFLVMGGLAMFSSLRALSQFAWMLKNCGASYGCLVGERISGFMSHWMTFGGEMSIALMILAAFLFFAAPPKRPILFWLACSAIIAIAIFAGGTRSVWLAAAVGGSYLLWCWKRWTVAVAPVVIALALLAAPGFLRERFTSAWRPHGDLDSNEHRRILWRTGVRMIQAHPIFGLGPEHVKLQFKQYLPPDVKRLPEGWYEHLHNIYLQYAAERGIPVLLIFIWLIGKILFDFTRALKGLPRGPSDERFILRGVIAAIIAILVGGILEHNLGDSEVLSLFLSIISCGYVAVESSRHVERPKSA